jgi:PACS-1 cytosolic sorting protein
LGQLLEGTQLSLDLDESINIGISSQLSSSPPNTGRASPTQPNTPQQAPQIAVQEPLELQVDYWPISRPFSESGGGGGDKKEKSQTKGQDQGKNSVKSSFKNLQVRSKFPSSLTIVICNKTFISHFFFSLFDKFALLLFRYGDFH